MYAVFSISKMLDRVISLLFSFRTFQKGWFVGIKSELATLTHTSQTHTHRYVRASQKLTNTSTLSSGSLLMHLVEDSQQVCSLEPSATFYRAIHSDCVCSANRLMQQCLTGCDEVKQQQGNSNNNKSECNKRVSSSCSLVMLCLLSLSLPRHHIANRLCSCSFCSFRAATL